MVFFKSNLQLCNLLYSFRLKFFKKYLSELSELRVKKNIQGQHGYEIDDMDLLDQKVRVKVLGSGALSTSKIVLLNCGDFSYLFNCGEGLQRIFSESKGQMSKVSGVFITYPSWQNISGIFGFILSISSVHKNVLVQGQQYINKVLRNAEHNILTGTKKIGIKVTSEKFISNGNISVECVYLYPTKNIHSNKICSEKPFSVRQEESITGDKKIMKNSRKENSSLDSNENSEYFEKPRKMMRLSSQTSSSDPEPIKDDSQNIATSYICETPKVLGTLLIEKCMELKVPPGPLLGNLKKGIDVTLENGEVVKSCDVKVPDSPGLIIIVMECPTEDYLDNLLESPEFIKYQTNDSNPSKIASLVIHFTSAYIVRNPKYQIWINRFPKHTKHLYINEDNKSLGMAGIYQQQYELSLLHPKIFPTLNTSYYPPPGNEIKNIVADSHSIVKDVKAVENESFDVTFFKCNGNNHIKGEYLTEVFLRCNDICDYACFSCKDAKIFTSRILKNKVCAEMIETLKKNIKKMEDKILPDQKEYPKILFLGTGSSIPSKRRNTSGILIFLNEKNSILLDCGEGTYVQMLRFFGYEKMKEILRNLSLIYISHMHADHHMGLISLLKARMSIFMNVDTSDKNNVNLEINDELHFPPNKYQPVYILAPPEMINWLNLWNSQSHNLSHTYSLIENSNFEKNQNQKDLDLIKKCLEITSFENIITVKVPHCKNAYGVSFIHKNGWKITYSGDTKPSTGLVDIGLNSDLLIHEATMEHLFWREAAMKQHSTTTQAIEVGKKMNAKFTLLTHFSQRYSHIPYISKEFTENVGIAFDNMLVSLSQLPILSKFIDILPYIYEKYHERLKAKQTQYVNSYKSAKDFSS